MRLYPDNIYAYNNIAYSYALRHEYETALRYFFRAEEVDPDDMLVLNNIAFTYINIGNKDKAREYFMKMVSKGMDEWKEYARAQIERL
jgi:Flp pilus assembly protein TadD